ncbi:MAG: hypothetical protein PWR00_1387, partial [Thermovirga sp.]|nr:hypothetical protein [Thermovirga sp.]
KLMKVESHKTEKRHVRPLRGLATGKEKHFGYLFEKIQKIKTRGRGPLVGFF